MRTSPEPRPLHEALNKIALSPALPPPPYNMPMHEPESLLPLLRRYAPWLAFAILAALTFAVYYPGLGGTFLLDDWGTLPKLGAYGPVDNFTTFISYITSGTAGPSGRPLALLSFLIDARSWPATPWAFKLTNVLLHLLNGALLAWLLTGLSRARGLAPRKAAWVGLLGAGLWMMHPLFVSTTLYVVQRMAMLAALFVFAGLACYVTGRRRLNEGRTRSAYALMIGGIAGGTVLGFFSKENAALLPLLALVLEWTVLRGLTPGTRNPEPETGSRANSLLRRWRTNKPSRVPDSGSRVPSLAFRLIFLWLPSALIIAYLLFHLRDLSSIAPDRDFSIGMRLMTEARIVVYYLYLLVIPHAATHGLYTVVPLSHSLLHPWTTLPAIALIAALIIGAFAVRRRWPILAAAVLFFFAGQLIESTTIPLELYYEHRNYLPAALLFWPLALWMVHGTKYRGLRWSSIALAFVVLLSLTGLRANLWGQPNRLLMTWMRLNPDSGRAIVAGVQTLTRQGKLLTAYRHLVAASREMPDNNSIAMARLGMACRLGGARPGDIRAADHAARYSYKGLTLIYKNVPDFIDGPLSKCHGMNYKVLAGILNNASANPNFQSHGARQQIALVRGQLLLAQKRPAAAYAAFDHALALNTRPAIALTASAYLLNANQFREAQKLLNAYEALPKHLPPLLSMPGLHRRWLDHIGWYKESFRIMRKDIKKALQQPAASASQ